MDVGMSPDKATFERRLVDFATRLDFPIVSAVLVIKRPSEASLVSRIGNTPASFLEASINEEDSKRDPVLQRMMSMSTPFAYDQEMYVKAGAGDLWEAQAPYGYKAGISIALHMAAGKHFLLGVDRDQPLPAEDEVLTRTMADLQLLAVFAQETAVRVLVPSAQLLEAVPQLTPRETEILRWTREGKTAWEIGMILSISEHAVGFHLRNVMRKLGVNSKHSAVLKAIGLGLLQA